MIKKKAFLLVVILFAGCPQSEKMVESNKDETTAPAKTEAVQDSSQSVSESVPTSPANATSPAAAKHPTLEELTSLLSLEIESDEVQSLVKKYQLQQSQKFDEGELNAEDHAFTLMFRANRVDNVILQASPWSDLHSDPNWSIYSHSLPNGLLATDGQKEVESKLGKPTKVNGDRWKDDKFELWVHFEEDGNAIRSVWVSLVE